MVSFVECNPFKGEMNRARGASGGGTRTSPYFPNHKSPVQSDAVDWSSIEIKGRDLNQRLPNLMTGEFGGTHTLSTGSIRHQNHGGA
jgi:hypothetical protein